MSKKRAMSRGQFLGTSLGLPLLTSSSLRTSVFRSPVRSSNEFELNEIMKQDREIAMKVLKPSKKDLEHGLDLHYNSLVVETYGFIPRASLDGDVFANAIKNGASISELKDMREDMYMTRIATDEREKKEFMNAFNAAGVTCVFQNAGEEHNDVRVVLKRLANFTYATDMMPDFLRRAVVPDDIELAKKENRHAIYFSGNAVPLPLDLLSVEEELRYIRVFFQLGVRMMHLTYNRRNLLGDGCAEKANAGLSDFGLTAIKEMNRTGVIIDVAHSGWKTSLEAAKASERPMVASHSCAAALNPHMRSKPDEVIRAIAESGGYIGICCVPGFLGGSMDIAAMMKHIDYVVKMVGFDHVGIGTDVAYESGYSAEQNQKAKGAPRATRAAWEALWPAGSYPDDPVEKQRSMSWTNFPMFTVGMVQMGYSDKDIQKILGGNAMRVARAALA